MAISTKSQSLRLYRNTDILESREEAVKAITAELSERRIDGEFMIVRYFCNKGDEQRPNFVIETILGVAAYDSHSVKTFVTIFDMDNIDNNIETLRIDMETAIASEAQARQEADDAINATINDTIIPTINQEIQDRKDADDALLTTINNEIKTAIEKEIEDRTQADDELRENVLNNELTIAHALTTLNVNCGFNGNGEYVTLDRDSILKQSSSLYSADKALAQAIRQEIADRTNSLNELSRQVNEDITEAINQEIANRVNGDNDLTNALNQEIDNRKASDMFISGEVDTLSATVNTNKTNIENALSEEITNRQNAISSLTESLATTTNNARVFHIEEAVSTSANVLKAYVLKDQHGNVSGSTIEIYKDSSLSDVKFENQQLKFTYILANGETTVVPVDVSNFLTEEEYADGLQVIDSIISVKKDADSEAFLSVSKNGVKVSGIQTAINTAVNTEASSRTAADTALQNDINAKYSAATSYTDSSITTLNQTLSQSLNSSKITSITVNNVASTIANNAASVTVHGDNIKLSANYSKVTYPNEKFTGVTHSSSLDAAMKQTEANTSKLVSEVLSNEEVTAENFAILASRLGVTSAWGMPTFNGPAAGATSMADAIAKLVTEIQRLQNRISALENQ